MSDVIALLRLLQSLSEQAERVSTVILRMREEGRETLLEDEKEELRLRDDSARQRLLEAIEEAEDGEG